MKIGLLFILAVPAMMACDTTTGTGEFTGVPPVRIAGSWTYSFQVFDASGNAHCETNGTALINQTQNGDQFAGGVSGVFICTEGSQSDGEQTALVAITAGEVSGLGVRFIAFGCVHLGTIGGDPPNIFSGTLNCTFPVTANGPARPFSGTWSATR
jgi:hypothetical protein